LTRQLLLGNAKASQGHRSVGIKNWSALRRLYDATAAAIRAGEIELAEHTREENEEKIFQSLLAERIANEPIPGDADSQARHGDAHCAPSPSQQQPSRRPSGLGGILSALGLKRGTAPAPIEKPGRGVSNPSSAPNPSGIPSVLQNALQELARDIATKNCVHNKKVLHALLPLRRRLDAISLAMVTVRRGDSQAILCLEAGRMEELLRVAEIKRRFDTFGRVDEAEWAYYLTAGGWYFPETLSGDGQFVRATIHNGGVIDVFLKHPVLSFSEGTKLSDLSSRDSQKILGFLRSAGAMRDAGFVASYIAAVWPDMAAHSPGGPSSGGPSPGGPSSGGHSSWETSQEDPFDVLGVSKNMGMPEIAEIFRRLMQAFDGLPNAAPQRRLIEAYKKVKEIKKNVA
jgi:hypothetical protein